MEPNSSIGTSPNSTGKQIVTESQGTALPRLKEQDTGKAILAQSEDITLAAIKESDAGKPLHVRVYRKWTLTNKQGKPVLFCCILIDHQGNAIQANVNIRDKNKFNALLQIDKTYKITGFGFQPANPWMQAVPHSLSLVFGTSTDINDIADTGFPTHYFNFTQYRDLYSKVDEKHGLLTDYIGSVQYVSGIQKSIKATKDSAVWRDIGIQSLDGRPVRFTLWNQDAHNFRQQEYEKAEKPTIIAVSSCLVKQYGGLQLSATAATSYYFNPDIPECHDIRSLYNEFIDPPTILNVQHQRCADPQQENFRNRVTLADLAKENPQNHQNVRFTVDATIDKIDTTRPWFFKKCSDCKSKISPNWPHTHCKQPTSEDEFLYSYCFRVQLSDGTAEAVMTCFSNEANSLVKDCKELLQSIPNQNSYDYPPEILSLQGKKKIFQLRFDPESTKERHIFILDTCWSSMPLLTAGTTTSAATSQVTQDQTSGMLQMKQFQVTTPTNKAKKTEIETQLPTNTTMLHSEATTTLESKDNQATPPTEQLSSSKTSEPNKEAPKKTGKRQLFTDNKDNTSAAVPKIPKKSA